MSAEIELATNGDRPALITPGSTPGTVAAAMDMLNAHMDLMDKAHHLAKVMTRTQMVPNIYRGKPDDAAAAILFGLELGLSPIQSLQNVIAVHGKPGIEARTMVALLAAKGYEVRTVKSTDVEVSVIGRAPDGREEPSTWTIERADKAGYVAKKDDKGEWIKNANGKIAGNTKYVTDPQAMLYAKAATEVCRKLAPHILLGMPYSREDLESEPDPEPIRVTSERVTPAEVIGDAAAQAGPVVQQWQPPAEEAAADASASEESAKPDTAQVDASAKASTEPVVEMATAAEQRTLSAELERHGLKTPAAKRKWLSADTGREIASAKELTVEEAISIISRLHRREAGDMPILQSQWANAAQMLDQLGADTAEKKVMFLRSFLQGRGDLRDPLDLNEREAAEVLAELEQLCADEQAASDTNGVEQ
jgi:hypothetical protein